MNLFFYVRDRPLSAPCIWNWSIKGFLMIDLDLRRCVHKNWVKMRNKEHFATLILGQYYFIIAFSHVFFISLNFQVPAKILNFILIEVSGKLVYLRWLNFIYTRKWLRRHTSCLHANCHDDVPKNKILPMLFLPNPIHRNTWHLRAFLHRF